MSWSYILVAERKKVKYFKNEGTSSTEDIRKGGGWGALG